jgi:hypothetical protein
LIGAHADCGAAGRIRVRKGTNYRRPQMAKKKKGKKKGRKGRKKARR